MVDKWLRFVAVQKINQLKKKNTVAKRAVNGFEAKSLLLLYRVSSQTALQELFMSKKQLEHAFPEIKTTCIAVLSNGLEKEVKNSDDCILITNKLTDWLGLPKQEIMDSLQKKSFDLAIDLSPKPHVVNKYLLSVFGITMAIGRYSQEMKLYYDFMISEKETSPSQEFIKNCIQRLQTINNHQ